MLTVELPTPTCLPVALPLQSSHVTPISSRVSMLCDGDRVIYFPHTDPVRSHATNPKPPLSAAKPSKPNETA